jgi:hypothetical protein
MSDSPSGDEMLPCVEFERPVVEPAARLDDALRRPHPVERVEVGQWDATGRRREGVENRLGGEIGGVGLLADVEITEVDVASADIDPRLPFAIPFMPRDTGEATSVAGVCLLH